MDAVVLFYAAVLGWISPLLAYPVLKRCPPQQVEFWLGVFVVTSWIGFAVFVWRYYGPGRPASGRCMLGEGTWTK